MVYSSYKTIVLLRMLVGRNDHSAIKIQVIHLRQRNDIKYSYIHLIPPEPLNSIQSKMCGRIHSFEKSYHIFITYFLTKPFLGKRFQEIFPETFFPGWEIFSGKKLQRNFFRIFFPRIFFSWIFFEKNLFNKFFPRNFSENFFLRIFFW